MRRRVLTLLLLISSATMAAPIGAFAQEPKKPTLDPQIKDAYPWRVLLKTGKHPVFSAAFREQLSREIRAMLQGTLGPVVTVEVIDLAAVPVAQWEPVWTEFAAKGWPALDTDPRRELNGVKTHGLTIDYRDGEFKLESRQHDGFTGLASPIVRKQTARTTDMLSRVAGLMIEPDFCPTGTVDIDGSVPGFVKVVLRGTGIIAPDKLAKIG
ncbi:MAG: hypothetical protein ACRCZF_21350, partial [Gemmataceae bacterium]